MSIEELKKKIYQPIIFAIPRSLCNGLSEQEINDLVSYGILDSLVYLSKDGSISYLNNNLKEFTLISKRQLLKENTLKLLQLQSELNQKTFGYLFSEYLSNLNAWIEFTEILVNILDDKEQTRHIYNYIPHVDSLFKFQYEVLNNHLIELREYFDNNYFSKSKDYTSNDIITIIKDVKTINNNNYKSLLSIQDVDKQLLINVFSIKEKYLNNYY